MELAFAGLHQLLAPLLDGLERLPAPQRDALRSAFGLSPGSAPDRFFIGLAVLTLLSDAADEQPVVCLVDDEQWLDRASAQVLAFVARRLEAESVGLVFATRGTSDELAALPQLVVEGLHEDDARALLDSAFTGPLDARVRDQIVTETRGNPLALLELPQGVTPAELAGGFALPGALPLSGRIEESFRRRLGALPVETRRLLQLAAADPVGEPSLLWHAAERLAIGSEAAAPAVEAGLIVFGARVQFRHPLVRSAAYRSASLQERQEVHGALAEVTDAEIDPDRRAWHRAQAAPGPDEDVAEELERSAGRAQARGGLAAAAAFLERAAMLTPEPARRAQRLLAAVRAKRDAGALEAALGLLVAVEAGPLDPLSAAEVEHLRGQIALEQQRGRDAARLLLSAARRLEPLNADLARETHLEALVAAMWVADLDNPGGVLAAAEAARAAPTGPEPPRPVDVLLDALAIRLTDGYAAAAPTLTSSTRAGSCFGRQHRRGRPLALARRFETQRHGRRRTVGRRVVAFPGRSPGSARPRHGRARAFAARAQPPGRNPPSRRRVDHGSPSHRRGSADRGGDRERADCLHRDVAGGLARAGGTGRRADRGDFAGGDRTRSGQVCRLRELRELGARERPRSPRRQRATPPGERSSATSWGSSPLSCPSWPRRLPGPAT